MGLPPAARCGTEGSDRGCSPHTARCPVCFQEQDAPSAAQTQTPASRWAAYLDGNLSRREGAPGPRGAAQRSPGSAQGWRGWASPSQGSAAKTRLSLFHDPWKRQTFTGPKVGEGSQERPGAQVVLPRGHPHPGVTLRLSPRSGRASYLRVSCQAIKGGRKGPRVALTLEVLSAN